MITEFDISKVELQCNLIRDLVDCNTVNSEIIARILFLQKAFKRHICQVKNSRL